MRRIAVLTGTRAEYGLLKNIIKRIAIGERLELQLIVTGTHLSKKYGYTVREIEADNIPVQSYIPIVEEETNSTAGEMGRLVNGINEIFAQKRPDILLVLGDRYEILAGAMVALAYNIPVAHISGGEVTEGAIDEQIRHAVTKLSHLHFPGTKVYADNIAGMGEERWRIFEYGDPGIENIKTTRLLSRSELQEQFNIKVDSKTLLITYHPVTLEKDKLPEQMEQLLTALGELENNMIITYPNVDQGGMFIIKCLERFAKERNNVQLVPSLGIQKYLSVMKLCAAVVGNSSSALVEAPYLKVPVVNIGDRQKGRLMAKNIIACDNSSQGILQAIKKATSDEFREYVVLNTESLYGEGNTSEKIVEVLASIPIDERLIKKKLQWSE